MKLQEKPKKYTCSYYFEGQKWSLDIQAKSHEEAVKRLRCLSLNGKVDGKVVAEIPIPLGWFNKLLKLFVSSY